MATKTTGLRAPYVPAITPEELARRNQAAIRTLESFQAEGDETEQRETLEVLRKALGDERVAGYRKVFS